VRDHVDKERIRIEILKALELPKPSLFFRALQDIGVLEFIFPDLVDCIGHNHGKHHREDVWTHNLIVGDAISPKFPLLRLAGFLHDVGKPAAWKKGKDGRFIGHERDGVRIAKKLLSALRFSIEEIEVVTNFIAVHMLPIGHLGAKGFRTLFAKISDHGVTFEEFLRLRIADRIGNLAKNNLAIEDVKDIVRKFRAALNGQAAPSVKNLAVNGHDVQDVLRIKPGPKVGQVLRGLFDFVLDVGFEFNTELILLAKIHEFRD
jgi:tRNA nucleotidyltransferase/poly(A) polymerase